MRAVQAFLQRRHWSPWVALAYAALIAVFLVTVARFYIPGKGFSYLIAFGGRTEASRLAALKGLNYYVQDDSPGYDAQYYAQIALHPGLGEPGLRAAVDSLPYRARRILFSATAYGLGLGRPAWIVQAYALQNALCWLGLAFVLLRWFPPTDWNRAVRWAGVLFSFGMCVSLRNSLIDGPSLLLLALGVWAVEAGRPWLATAVLGASGLGKETNLLGAAALLPPQERGWPAWRATLAQGALVAAPLVLWLLFIQWRVGPATDLGARNFDWPLFAYGRKWLSVAHELGRADTWRYGLVNAGACWSFVMMLALTVQVLFLVLRPQPQAPWGRVGLSFAVLLIVLGDAVWEGYPGAASRVLLPLQLAFNVLVPCGRGWWVVLLIGNLTILNAPNALEPPVGNGYELTGPSALLDAADGSRARVDFGPDWYGTETFRGKYWHWSRGDAEMRVTNVQAVPVVARLRFTLSGADARTVRIATADGTELWRGEIRDTATAVDLASVVLAPGENRLLFTTDRPAVRPPSGDPRTLAFCVKSLAVDIRRPTDGSSR